MTEPVKDTIRLIVVTMVTTIAITFGLLTVGYVLTHRTNQATRLARQNREVSRETQRLAQEIQRSRLDACRRANARHSNSIRVFQQELAKFLKTHNSPAEKRQASASAKANIAIINALAPQQDCRQTIR